MQCKKTALTYLLLVVSSIMFSQTFTYEYTYKLDSTDLNRISQDVLNLDINNSHSLFYSLNRIKRNNYAKALETEIENNTLNLKSAPKSGVHWSIKNDTSQGSVVVYEDYSIYKYKYSDQINLDWQLQDSTKLYDHLKLNKATTSFRGRDYIAWYTLEIPLSYGPYKFYGLPGLIVEIYDENKHHHFKMVETSQIRLDENYFSEFKLISKDDFKEFFDKYESNPMSLIPETEGFGIPENQKKIHKERMEARKARRNNFIELR